MVLGNGVFISIMKRGFRRLFGFGMLLLPTTSQILVCNKSSKSDPLLLRLLQEPISRFKIALDLEEDLTLPNDPFFWRPLITALRSSSPQKAQLVLEWRLEKMLEKNDRDHCCYSELISLCEKAQNVPFAMRVFTSMEAHGIRPTSTVLNSLISTCLSSGNVMTALSLFEIMERSEEHKPSCGTYNAFISFYSKLGDAKAMQAWFSARKAAGFCSDIQTYESVIIGLVKSKHFDPADRFYEEMMMSGITPTVAILEAMLDGLCERKKLSNIKVFLKFILDGGWGLNGKMVEKLLALYLEQGKVEEMEELLGVLKMSNPDPGVLPQVHCGIIRMYATADRLDDLEYCVGRMLKLGMSFTCPDDVEKIICSYFRRAAYERLEMFLERIRGSHVLTKSTFDLLVAGYRRAGLSEKLDLVIKDRKLAGFS
ncbi:pentatricopeptide repeat-containing protein PPR5 homolog, chloroplastic-like [Macadamia integrifolia]|uniref:pentatricopeptide repeat-containing protein PPR5 homolog, chloroplastic-like n=1 Tax=Macadamia integrifolia TaxID=60698 RepID=UPI001C4EA26E|nr:pentatricopeptide repeat-containing protein PPR5 homolog, chloroplastic-like [Macadamia integrifolia]